jgi:hypothetical protein
MSGAGSTRWRLDTPRCRARAIGTPGLLERMLVDGVGDSPLQAANRFFGSFTGGRLRPHESKRSVSRRSWVTAADVTLNATVPGPDQAVPVSREVRIVIRDTPAVVYLLGGPAVGKGRLRSVPPL